jgi:polyisoprenoid-binding protein YceI
MTPRQRLWPLCAALALAGGGAGLGSGAAAQPVAYVLDPERSVVHFEVLHFGTSTVRGRFGPVSGGVTLDRNAGRGEINLQMATAAVDTGVRVFDVRLREPDLLASAEFPAAYFVATQMRFEEGRLAEVRGEITLRGVSQPLSLRAIRFACLADAAGNGESCGGDFEGELRRSDFGINFGLPFIADRVRLFVAAQGRRVPG